MSNKRKAEESSTSTSNKKSKQTLCFLTCVEDSHDKFYELSSEETGAGFRVYIRYGRNGTPGVNSFKDFDNENDKDKFVRKTIDEKLKKGYKHSGDVGAAEAPHAGTSVKKETKPATKVKAEAPPANPAPAPARRQTNPTPPVANNNSERNVTGPLTPEQTKAQIKAAVAIYNQKYIDNTPDKDTAKYHVYMESPDGKFYDIRVDGTGPHIKYGKIGSAGCEVHMNLCSYAALTTIETKVMDKLRKGYRELPPPQAEIAQQPDEQVRMVKAIGAAPGHYNDHLFYISRTGLQVSSQFYVNREYCTQSNKMLKTELAPVNFMNSKIQEYADKGYVQY